MRHVRLGEIALLGCPQLIQQLDRAAHLADAQPAVAVRVEQVEQAAAVVGQHQRHGGRPGAPLHLNQVVEVGDQLLFVDLAVAVAVDDRELAAEKGAGLGLLLVQVAVAVLVGLAELAEELLADQAAQAVLALELAAAQLQPGPAQVEQRHAGQQLQLARHRRRLALDARRAGLADSQAHD